MSSEKAGNQLPDPMPDDAAKRAEIEFALDQMRQQEVVERGNATQDVEIGTPPQEVLQDLGGYAGARATLGETTATELQKQAVAGPRPEELEDDPEQLEDDPEQLEDVQLIGEVMAKDSSEQAAKVSEQLRAGVSAQAILDRLGGADEAVRKLGEVETQKLLMLVEYQKGEN